MAMGAAWVPPLQGWSYVGMQGCPPGGAGTVDRSVWVLCDVPEGEHMCAAQQPSPDGKLEESPQLSLFLSRILQPYPAAVAPDPGV